MNKLIRVLSFSIVLGLSSAVFAQSNPSGNNPPSPAAETVQESQNNNGGGQNAGSGAATLKDASGQTGSQQATLSQQEISQINQTIAQLQSQLQQIGDPNDPRAVKLQATIDKYQNILNNQ